MSATLIKNVSIQYPGHQLDGKTVDLLISNGRIKSIGKNLKDDQATVIDRQSVICLPALVDAQCTIGEPGLEEKETLESAAKAANAGGFSHLIMLPNTDPCIDNKAQLQFIRNATKSQKVQIMAYGAVSLGANGTALSEMFDMRSHGAVAFTDGKNSVQDANLMKRALEYAKNFDGWICNFPNDHAIAPGGLVNESVHNTHLGLKQSPSLAEELMLVRDLELLRYTASKLLVSTISTERSVTLIKEYKAKSLNLLSSVALPNLLYTENDLSSFDSNFKTLPLLRGESDRQALIKGIKQGTIDIICTDHTPENIENKEREFDHANPGMTMLETALSLVNEHLIGSLTWGDIAKSMSMVPRKFAGLPMPDLEAGANFEFTLFDTETVWTYNGKTAKSLSANSPVFGQELKGKVLKP